MSTPFAQFKARQVGPGAPYWNLVTSRAETFVAQTLGVETAPDIAIGGKDTDGASVGQAGRMGVIPLQAAAAKHAVFAKPRLNIDQTPSRQDHSMIIERRLIIVLGLWLIPALYLHLWCTFASVVVSGIVDRGTNGSGCNQAKQDFANCVFI